MILIKARYLDLVFGNMVSELMRFTAQEPQMPEIKPEVSYMYAMLNIDKYILGNQLIISGSQNVPIFLFSLPHSH